MSVKVVAGFFLQDFDEGGQVGPAGAERGRGDWKVLIQGLHC